MSAELRKEIQKDNDAYEKEKKDYDVKQEEKTIGTAAGKVEQKYKTSLKEANEAAGKPLPLVHRKDKAVAADHRLKGFASYLSKLYGKDRAPNLLQIQLLADAFASCKETVRA